MKKFEFTTRTKIIFLGFLAIMLMLPCAIQAQKIPFLQSTIAPAAEGYVKIKTDHNDNNVIKIRIKNFAEIETLAPTKQTYVVWMVTDRETTENIGRINSSNRLNVSFEAVSSFKPIKIFITTEKNESAQVPGGNIVLSTENFWE